MNKLFKKGVSVLLAVMMVSTCGICVTAQDMPQIPGNPMIEEGDTFSAQENTQAQAQPEGGEEPEKEIPPMEAAKGAEEEIPAMETELIMQPAALEVTVTVEGNPKPGYTLSAVCGEVQGEVTYQWLSASEEMGDYSAIDGAASDTLVLKNNQGNKFVKVSVSVDGALVTESEPVKIAPALGPINTISEALPNAVATTPAEFTFQLKNNPRVFSVLDETEDDASKYFVMGIESYCKSIFDLAGGQNGSSKFDPESKDNIGWMVNNVLTGKADSWTGIKNATIYQLPAELVAHIDTAHQWLTEGGKTKPVPGPCPDDYLVTAGVSLLSFTEYSQYADKIGYNDNAGNWFLRTARGAGIDHVARTDCVLYVQVSSPPGRTSHVGASEGSSGSAVRPVFYLDRDFFASVALNADTMGEAVKQMMMKNYTVGELSALYTKEELEAIGFVNLPEAREVSVSGAMAQGQTLQGKYTYFSPNDMPEGTSTFRWLAGDSADGAFTPIDGATAQNWTVEPGYAGKYIKFEVMPRNQIMGGMITESSAVGPIREEQPVTITNMRLSKTGAVNPGDQVVLSADVKSDAAKTLYAMIALYDGGQRMVDAIFAPITAGAGTGSYTVTLEAKAAGDTISAAILDSNDLLRPLGVLGENESTGGVAVSTPIAIEQSAVDYSVTVRGTIAESAFNRLVFLYIADKEKKPIYAAAVKTDGNGAYVHRFHMPSDAASDDYAICAGAYDKTSDPYSMSFYYANNTEVEAVYGQVSALTNAKDIQEFLNIGNNQTVLGISNPFFTEVPLEVCQALAVTGAYNSIADFKQVAMTEMAVQALLKKGTSLEKVKEIIVFFDAYFNFSAEKNYEVYSELIGDKTLGKKREDEILSGFVNAGCKTMARVRTRFNELVILQLLAETTDYKQVEELLKAHKEELTVDLTDGDFLKLKDPGRVFAKLIGMRFTSAEALSKKFDELVAQQLEAEKPPKKNNGGGGGGGGALVGNPNAVVPTPYEPVNPDSTTTTEQYNDLGGVSWAEEAIVALSEKQIVQGYGDGTFLPNQTITREEFVKMVITAFDIGVDAAAKPDFDDVPADSWYAPYLAAAKNAGIVEGYADGTFGVGVLICRQDMAAMLYRAVEDLDKTLHTVAEEKDFMDQEQIGEYAAAAVKALQMAGVISGTPEGYFESLRNATRAEACVMVHKLINGGAMQ